MNIYNKCMAVQIGVHKSNHNLSLSVHLLPLTWSMTLLINALTDGVKISLVLWKHHKTIPPLLNMVNKSNILQPPSLSLNSCWSDNYSRKHVTIRSHHRIVIRGRVATLGQLETESTGRKTWSANRSGQLCYRCVHGSEVTDMPIRNSLTDALPCVPCGTQTNVLSLL